MFLLVLLCSCRPADRAFPGHQGAVVASPSELTVGPASLDGTESAELHVWNEGGGSVALTSEVFGVGFDVLGGPWSLVAGSEVTITVLFTPEGPENGTGTLVLSAGSDDSAGVTLTGLVDVDWDDDGFEHVLAGGTDCDDREASIHPDVTEVWYDGVDQDCDGNDSDQDLDGAPGTVDCDDLDPSRWPDATEIVDGIDQDCDGVEDECAEPGSIVFTEIFLTPTGVPAFYGQWLEVTNVSGIGVGLGGWTVRTSKGAGVVSPSVMAMPGEPIVLCPNVDLALNGDVPCDGVVSPWPLALTEADSLELAPDPADPLGLQDDVSWDAAWVFVAGTALALDPALVSATSNDDFASWCPAVEPWAKVDFGSPGMVNLPCPPP